MGLTTILSQEHKVVLEKLLVLEGALPALDVDAIEEVLHFMEESLPLHRQKEEELLFPALGKHIGVEDGPIAIMLSEHVTEKGYVVELRRALDERKAGGGADENVRRPALSILQLLRAHIAKEDEILFPMEEHHLTPEEQAEVARGMDAIGACCAECGRA